MQSVELYVDDVLVAQDTTAPFTFSWSSASVASGRHVSHLIYMYMVGSALNQTNLFDGSSKKNSVPFMSKMANMRSIITLAAPSLQANQPPAELVEFIDTYSRIPIT